MCYIKDQFRASALHEEKIAMVISSHDADKFHAAVQLIQLMNLRDG